MHSISSSTSNVMIIWPGPIWVCPNHLHDDCPSVILTQLCAGFRGWTENRRWSLWCCPHTFANKVPVTVIMIKYIVKQSSASCHNNNDISDNMLVTIIIMKWWWWCVINSCEIQMKTVLTMLMTMPGTYITCSDGRSGSRSPWRKTSRYLQYSMLS